MDVAVVVRAEGDVRAEVGAAAPRPRHQVVHLEVAGAADGAAGHPAPAVAVLDQAAGALGDDALLAADRHGQAVDLAHERRDGVAAEPRRHRGGDRPGAVQPARGRARVDVHVHPVVRPPRRRRHRGQRAGGDLDEGVGVGGLGVAGGEPGVPGLAQRLLDEGSLVGRRVEGQQEAAVVVAHPQTRRAVGPLGAGGPRLLGLRPVVRHVERVPAEQALQLRHRRVRGEVGDRLLVGDRRVPHDDDGLLERQPALLHVLLDGGQLRQPPSHLDHLARPRRRRAGVHHEPVRGGAVPAVGPAALRHHVGGQGDQRGVRLVQPRHDVRRAVDQRPLAVEVRVRSPERGDGHVLDRTGVRLSCAFR
ncbi:hypothetical protein GCM10028777_40420 [Angustibacter speluncae]